jgi:hypothetical protein
MQNDAALFVKTRGGIILFNRSTKQEKQTYLVPPAPLPPVGPPSFPVPLPPTDPSLPDGVLGFVLLCLVDELELSEPFWRVWLPGFVAFASGLALGLGELFGSFWWLGVPLPFGVPGFSACCVGTAIACVGLALIPGVATLAKAAMAVKAVIHPIR